MNTIRVKGSFFSALKTAATFAGKPNSTPRCMTCVHVDFRAGHAEATDRFALCRSRFDAELIDGDWPDRQILLEARAMKRLASQSEIKTQPSADITVEDDSVTIRAGDYAHTFPTLDAQFPILGKVISNTLAQRGETFREGAHFDPALLGKLSAVNLARTVDDRVKLVPCRNKLYWQCGHHTQGIIMACFKEEGEA